MRQFWLGIVSEYEESESAYASNMLSLTRQGVIEDGDLPGTQKKLFDKIKKDNNSWNVLFNNDKKC